ncbi:MAG: ATP-binding cassette domain-containing protein, partial [Duodenibacillus sp.]|nr:ATP-binding cassette domain-containing protein [Oscillospiraceae bacterium]MCF0253850.1 ATP-binding cassette domain-containing protein [Duodenibacillus sp.]
KASVAAASIFSVLDAPWESDQGKRALGRARGEIEYCGVTVRYPGQQKDALHALDLKVGAGEHVALVGESGSGKTTVANLLPRFWEPTAGRILLDGVDIKDLTLESLRRQISIVSQDVMLFDDTLLANIKYGCEDASDEAVAHAVKAAQLEDVVASLPQGLKTRIGEAGCKLSGGQRQRVAIARAILKDAPVLILDEATSALDSESEQAVKLALADLTKGRTTLAIAHRLSSLDEDARIFVMSEGCVVEQGSPAELLAQKGVFAQLWNLQSLENY